MCFLEYDDSGPEGRERAQKASPRVNCREGVLEMLREGTGGRSQECEHIAMQSFRSGAVNNNIRYSQHLKNKNSVLLKTLRL